MDIVQVILSTLIIQAGAEYYISERTSQWRDTVGQCNMATPDLHPTQDGFTVNIDHDGSKGDVWVGYFKKMTVFDYIGCVRLNNHNYSHIGQINTPGLCYTICKGKEMIGVSHDKCICVDTLETYHRKEINCTTSCGPRNEGVACGSDGYMSVYKVNRNVSTIDRKQKCMFFEQYSLNDKRFNWNNCASYILRVVCANESTLGDQSRSWLDSMNECFKTGSLPKSYQALKEIQSNMNPFWSGVISSDAIYSYTEWDKNLQGVRFGYMSANKSVYFTDTDEPKVVLCNSSNSNSTDSARGDSITTTDTKNTSTSQLSHSNTKGQDVSVIIGVSVCACVVIIAVVAFIILRRRGVVPNLREIFTRTCCTGQDAMMKDNVDKPPTVIKDSTPETVNSKEKCNNYTNNAHTYFVLEPSNSDHNMHVINSHERNQPKENGNIYNEIESEADSNTAYARVDKKKTSSPDDDYDITETAAMKLKSKADNINGDYAELGNNTYSHIGKSPTNVGTDQTYNIPNHDDSHSKTDEDNDENDTYSHLNSKQSDGCSNNPDNVYNTCTTNANKNTII